MKTLSIEDERNKDGKGAGSRCYVGHPRRHAVGRG